MDPTSDANWWYFSIDPQQRGNRIVTGPGGRREVNPALPDGRHLLDYQTYIGLEKLLSCQTPTSLVPDERAFIVTHQFFELAFKLMIFDLGVVAATLTHLLQLPNGKTFDDLCCGRDEVFWRPALTASGRLAYNAASLLPALTGFLSSAENREQTFSSREFSSFRPNLQPASGFQSAQFRLIQRALGKAGLLGVRLFPAQEYWRNYEAVADRGPVRVIDPVILRHDAVIAEPAPDSPLAPVAGLDDCAHHLLDRLAGVDKSRAGNSGIPLLPGSALERAVVEFQRMLDSQRRQQERAGAKPADAAAQDQTATAIFRHDLEVAFVGENERRAALSGACAGARRLRELAPESCLGLVLQRIVSTDTALHGKQEESFLSRHFQLAAQRIRDLHGFARQAGAPAPPSGTGGGGVPYLGQMRMNLIPLFPALVAWRETESVIRKEGLS